MNNIIIYTGAFRFPVGDAAAPRVLNNAKILRSLGYHVVFLSFGGEYREQDRLEDGSYSYQGFRYIITNDIDVKLCNPIKRILRFMMSGQKAIKLIDKMISEAQYAIAYQPSDYFTNRMLKLCKQHNKKFITDLTEWYDPNEFPGGKFAFPAWMNEWNMRHTQRKVMNKIVISSFLDNYYRESNNIILPPLVDIDDDKWSAKKEVLPAFDGIRIIYAGTPARKDLLNTMLEAVVKCLDKGLKIQFVVVGVSMQDIKNYACYNQVHRFTEHIQLLGRVAQEDVPSYYQKSDFSVIVRENNRKNKAGFPTKFVESMTSGCPVIVNYTSDLRDYLQDGYNGFLSKDFTSEALIEVLEKVVTLSKEELLSMKENCHKTAVEKFHYSSYVNEMKAFIGKIK